MQQLAMSDADDGDPRRKSSLLKFDKVRIPKYKASLSLILKLHLFSGLHIGQFT